MDITNRRTFIKYAGATLGGLVLAPSVRAEKRPGTWEAIMSGRWEKPRKLAAFAGVHPRLFMTADRLERLKSRITTSHKAQWEVILEKAESYLGAPIPLDHSQQGDMRNLGRGIPWQALAYRVTGEAKYLESAKRWVLGACRLPRWEQNNSLAGGECLFGVAIAYDWLYGDWAEEERTLIREKLILQGRAMKNGPPVHHDRWLANHNHVEHNGLATAGLALFDEVPEVIEWIRQADLVFRTLFEFASNDGSSNEGHQYWAYTTEAALRYLELARDLLGHNYYDSPWLKSVPAFVISSTIPDFAADNCVMSFGDSHRDFSSHGPTHILYRLAAEYRNQPAQWLAKEMDKRNVGRGDYCTWLNLFWYDETLLATPISTLPTFWNSEDVGWVTMRSGWDRDAVMVGFKCAPMHGHKAQEYYNRQFREKWPEYHEIGGGHGHPDVNSFQIYAYGKWLAIDPMYERPKWTKTHNTLLVNGQGQVGEGKTWFDRDAVMRAAATSKLIKAEDGKDFDYVIGDAQNIYPAKLGLKTFLRHVVFVKPDLIVLLDELKADRASDFEWLLHGEESAQKLEGPNCLLMTGEVAMDVHFLLPSSLELQVSGKSVRGLLRQTKDSQILVVLHPRKSDSRPSRALLETAGPGGSDSLRFVVESGQRKFSIQLNTREKTVKVAKTSA